MNNYFNSGLNDEEVIKSRKKYGSNSITEKKQNKFIDFLLDALADPIIKILLIALAIKLVFLFKDFDLFETLDLKNNISLLKRYLKLLNKREKEIIIKRYGLNNTKDMTQKEIADELKISRSYVSRIEKRALTKMLTEFIKNKNID